MSNHNGKQKFKHHKKFNQYKNEKSKQPFQFKKKESKHKRIDDNVKTLKSKYDSYDSKKVKSFDDLPLSTETLKALKEAGYTEPTEIQKESIVLGLRGLDILGAAKTGSGKTLAFLVPILEKLYSLKWSRDDGAGALVITPTRELAYQIFGCLRDVGKNHDFSAGLIIGGKDLKYEWDRMGGCNILICTPGRLLQHLDENPSFSVDGLQMLVLDEADRCLDLGFSTAINSIVSNLPAERQTLLFSATQTRNITDLARLSLSNPVFVSVHEHSAVTTPDNLRQSYIVTEPEHKVNILWSFLKSHNRKKTVVFLSSCKQTKYYSEIFSKLKPGMSVMGLYGTLSQLRRMAIYDNFCAKDTAVLFATDIAARGLDFPKVDWVMQLDCPEDATTYTHRAGRTARHRSGGEALLVLTPSEEKMMIKALGAARIPIEKIEVNPSKMHSITGKISALLAGNKELKETAQRAFVSYIKSVSLMKNKQIFDVKSINTTKFAESLGLAVAPRVRFLERRENKIKAIKADVEEEEETSNEDLKGAASNEDPKEAVFNEDEDSDDEMFSVKRVNHQIEDGNDVLETENVDISVGKKDGKVITKAQVAKKLIKKKIGNTKITFDDDGDVVIDGSKQKLSKEGQDYECDDEERIGGGIDINQAKEILKAEDKFDKASERARIKDKHKEAKKKLKEERARRKAAEKGDDEKDEESDEGSEPDLSWLPDPDKLYGKEEGNEENDEAQSEDGEADEDETETVQVKEGKRSLTVIKSVIPSKKLRKSSSEDDSSDDEDVLDTGLSLGEDEDLALKLLLK